MVFNDLAYALPLSSSHFSVSSIRISEDFLQKCFAEVKLFTFIVNLLYFNFNYLSCLGSIS